jgi:hypothetical protein
VILNFPSAVLDLHVNVCSTLLAYEELMGTKPLLSNTFGAKSNTLSDRPSIFFHSEDEVSVGILLKEL